MCERKHGKDGDNIQPNSVSRLLIELNNDVVGFPKSACTLVLGARADPEPADHPIPRVAERAPEFSQSVLGPQCRQ